MPNQLVNPSPSLMERLLGMVTPSAPQADPEFDKRMALAQQNMQKEMPNEMAGTSIQPTGMFGRMKDNLVAKVIGGVPVATTSPFHSITYNPEIAKGMSQNELEDTLAHELTHVGQYNKQPMWKNLVQSVLPQPNEGLPAETAKSYSMQGWDPSYRGKSTEMEAYQAESNRAAARGEGSPYDIFLRPAKNKVMNTGPSTAKLTQLSK